MDQFGQSMNFLRIKQVLVIIFYIKNQFLLLIIKSLWSVDCSPKTETCRGPSAIIP
jgi:hypothetical protein